MLFNSCKNLLVLYWYSLVLKSIILALEKGLSWDSYLHGSHRLHSKGQTCRGEGSQHGIKAITFSPNRREVASLSRDWTKSVWETETYESCVRFNSTFLYFMFFTLCDCIYPSHFYIGIFLIFLSIAVTVFLFPKDWSMQNDLCSWSSLFCLN